MTAGLPGIGLGGLFFIISALVAPLVELVRTLRGTSSWGAWVGVGRNFVLALAMIAAIELTLRLAEAVVGGAGVERASADGGAFAMPLIPLGITAALLSTAIENATNGIAVCMNAASMRAWVSYQSARPVPADFSNRPELRNFADCVDA